MREGVVRGVLILLGLATSVIGAKHPESGGVVRLDGASSHEQCDAANVDSWVALEAERVRGHDDLFGFAASEFGLPVRCDGMVTQELDGVEFGRVTFRFPDGESFERETMPPAVVIVTLARRSGFDDVEKVRRAVQDYADASGLSIDWTSPDRTEVGHLVTEQYWDPDPGLNGSATLTWSSGALVSVRVSWAP